MKARGAEQVHGAQAQGARLAKKVEAAQGAARFKKGIGRGGNFGV